MPAADRPAARWSKLAGNRENHSRSCLAQCSQRFGQRFYEKEFAPHYALIDAQSLMNVVNAALQDTFPIGILVSVFTMFNAASRYFRARPASGESFARLNNPQAAIAAALLSG